MKKAYVRDDGKFIGKHSIRPLNAVAEIPAEIPEEDYPYLIWTGSQVLVDETFKAQKQAELAQKDELSVLYTNMVADVLGQMQLVFGTPNSDTAIANRETWKDMIVAPIDYATEGLKSPEILRDANDNILFGIGDDLNTEQKVLDYANRKIQQARDYGIWRIKRLDQYNDDKNTILGV